MLMQRKIRHAAPCAIAAASYTSRKKLLPYDAPKEPYAICRMACRSSTMERRYTECARVVAIAGVTAAFVLTVGGCCPPPRPIPGSTDASPTRTNLECGLDSAASVLGTVAGGAAGGAFH